MAEDVFKNIQVLKGIPVKEFMNTMGFFSAATNLNCIDCHSPQSLEGYALDTPRKQTARRMVLMVNQINQSQFGGRRVVTCYTCHRANDRPEAIPSLLDRYSIPEDNPNRVEVIAGGPVQSVKKITAEQILDKYIQAIGGAAQAARLTSFIARGTYEGYDTLSAKVPVEIFANSPSQMATVVHTQNGDSVTTYDGRNGWIAAAEKLMRVLPLDGGVNLEGAKMDATLSFPARIKQDVQWRTGFPSVSIDDQPGRGDPERRTRRDRRKVVLRQRIGAFGASSPLRRHGGRRHPHASNYSDYREVAA